MDPESSGLQCGTANDDMQTSRSVHTFVFVFASDFNIVSMVMLTLTQRSGMEPILCICNLLPLLIIFSKKNAGADVDAESEWDFKVYIPLPFIGWYNANKNFVLTSVVVVNVLSGFKIPGPPSETLGVRKVVIAGSSM